MRKTTPRQEPSFPCSPTDLELIIRQMLELRADLLDREKSQQLDNIHPANLNSARNLLHYMAFRLHDLRDLQLLLSEWGLSSLGRAERKVQATVDTVLTVLHRLAGLPWNPTEKPPVCYREGRRLLENNTEKLLGEATPGRRVRIMVTMPPEAAHNYDLVKSLLVAGMNCARINCAHDGPAIWLSMIENIRRAAEATDRHCRIHMDLGGPKLRTGPIAEGPAILKVKVSRNNAGELTAPGLVWLSPKGSSGPLPQGANVQVSMPAQWLGQCKPGDLISLTDARGAKRRLEVRTASKEGVMAASPKNLYLSPKTEFKIKRSGGQLKQPKAHPVGDFPRLPGAIPLQPGDLLLLTKGQEPGQPAEYGEAGQLLRPAFIPCSVPEVLDDLALGEPVWFDDGKIGGLVEKIGKEGVYLRINQTRPGGDTLKSEKGINLPESRIRLNALTPQDLQDLQFVVQHADIVGLSFANTPEDVSSLIARMQELRSNIPSIVLKIETKTGFDNLPNLLLSAMQGEISGVMIARGDLAIECGFGRLAEVQEQILWVCEAAHVPVIWATQVLEGLAKLGLPTRAEVTDAAMGQRAECIMLNKGEHILDATKSLAEILLRMQDHQTKKRSMLRRLHLAEKFFAPQ